MVTIPTIYGDGWGMVYYRYTHITSIVDQALIGKSLVNGPSSTAMFDYQRITMKTSLIRKIPWFHRNLHGKTHGFTGIFMEKPCTTPCTGHPREVDLRKGAPEESHALRLAKSDSGNDN